MSSVAVVGIPVAEGSVGPAGRAAPAADTFLSTQGLSKGIQSHFKSSLQTFPLRIWIIDNSGSMATGDGHRLVRGAGGKQNMVASSRWQELGDSLVFHAQMAANLGAPTEFRLLNPPGSGQPQVLQCGVEGGAPDKEIDAMRKLVATGPTGRTPLCAQIREVVAHVRGLEGALRQAGQRCVIVIASDGAATDGDIAEAMRPLQALPVWIVVRLCTDQDEVVQYWNKVDEDLELDMDVIDDLSGEAAEVEEQNPWLTYAMPLHRLREWGSMNKVMDLLDERTLTAAEVSTFLVFLFGDNAAEIPDLQLDWPGFERGLTALLEREPTVWDATRGRDREWVSLSKLRRLYGPGGSGCQVM